MIHYLFIFQGGLFTFGVVWSYFLFNLLSTVSTSC